MKEYSQENVDKEITKQLAEQKVPNILICGKTGVGKSSVVKYVFNDSVKIDIGDNAEPCSRGITLYKNSTVNIYDSEGYEIGGEKQADYEKLIFDEFLAKPNYKGLGADAVHLVWYAVSGASKKFTDLDVRLIKRIKAEGFPVCVLVTKIDDMDESELKNMISALREDLPDTELFRVSIYARQDEKLMKFCDWDKLIDWSYKHLAGVFKQRFVMALRGRLDLKRKQAAAVVAGSTAAAAAVGASPIPFSDAALLVPIQTGMITGIAGIYGIPVGKLAMGSLPVDVAISALGKSVAGGLMKLIPVIGTVVGNIINASVAAAITGALGGAFSELCYKQCKDLLDGKPPTIDIEQILSGQAFIDEVLKLAKEKKMKEPEINTMILGQTGVGKSSLINYLYGKDVVRTGTGKPETGRGEFTKISVPSPFKSDVKINIFDSWGLESDKAEDWEAVIDDKLNSKLSFDEMVYAIVYCSSYANNIQDFEIRMLKKL